MKKLFRTGKKTLSVFLALLMMMTVFMAVPFQSAAVEHNFVVKKIVPPTCTEKGYTLHECTDCGDTYKDAYVDALGHDFNEWYIVENPDVDGAYAKKHDCQRDGCGYTEYETDSNGIINVYYSVTYQNEWTTATYDKTVDGVTPLASSYKTATLSTIYVLKGTAAVYPGKTPVREKDINYGAYQFTGWAVTDSELSLDNVTDNMVANALFQSVIVYYKVRFFNVDGTPLTNEQTVVHGQSAQYPFDNPTTEDNVHYHFTFSHWDYDYRAVYDNVGVRAIYDKVAKNYVVVYHDWDGTELGRETVAYAAAAKNVPTGLTRADDAKYVYEFANKWSKQNGEVVDMNNFTVQVGTVENSEVDVYATYLQRAKRYDVKFWACDPNYELCEGANAQILDSKGYLVTTGTLDENSEVAFTLTYDTSYTLVITTADKRYTISYQFTLPQQAAVQRLQLGDNENYDDAHEADNCSCICHAPFGALWIKILNLLYRWFGIKYVCCYDMYQTHADELAYGVPTN